MDELDPEKTEPPPADPEAVPIPYAASGRGLHDELYSLPARSQPSEAFVVAMAAGLANDRLKRFRATFGGSTPQALRLYNLDQALAAGLMSLMSSAEVLVRESMHLALVDGLGHRWFDRSELFDYRTKAGIDRGKRTLGGSRAASKVPAGKVIASFSFGVWCDLLARGSAPEKNSHRAELDYEATLWEPHLRAAFPQWPYGRSELEDLVLRVKYARNRVAHHEPLVFGIPLPGVYAKGGQQVRLRPATVVDDILTFVGAVNPVVAAELRDVVDTWPVLKDGLLADAEKHAVLVLNAEIDASVSRASRSISFGNVFAAQGLTTVALDEGGELRRYHPDGSTSLVE